IPLARFTNRHEPDIHIHVDASDKGLWALYPARQEYIQVEFSGDEVKLIQEFNISGTNNFGINVRELMRAVFASLVWFYHWHPTGSRSDSHVWFWIDNVSVVSWNNRRASWNEYAQMLIRILGICEVHHGFYSTGAHIAGSDNTMADAGSRVWQSPSLKILFSKLSSEWQRIPVPSDLRDLSRPWVRYCEQVL
ncbi:hypothetical protein JG687_00019665, partial [Phytophthora cactorum]